MTGFIIGDSIGRLFKSAKKRDAAGNAAGNGVVLERIPIQPGI